jgi:glycerol-3-phosphate dehydrogenase (NAD(P)+)
MKITVIGCGRWGSFIAWYLDKIGHNVTVYGLADAESFVQLRETRTNGLITYPDSIALTTDISVVSTSDTVIISIGSQGLRSLMSQIKALEPKNKNFVLCMKGIEIGTGCRLSQIASEYLDESNTVSVWIGPGHVQEFAKGIPNCMVIDSNSENAKNLLVKEFSSSVIRFYYGSDLIGNEIGAASKNVIGIAAGMLDGIGLSSLKGALMSRGTREISRLIAAMGGNPLSAYGLCHLGDYEATVFSQYSHNRRFGEMFVNGEKFEQLAEGYYTAKAMKFLSEKYNVDLPICTAVYKMLYENADYKKTLDELFSRSLKQEF